MPELRVIDNPDEIRKFPPIIESAWGMPDMASALRDVINAMKFHGGLVLGAYEDREMIGMQFSFPGYKKGKVYLYSHMTGVKEAKKYSGLGTSMKLFQKKWAIENGYDLIAWTFDPARSLNAYFNLHKLGAVSRTLLPQFYGTMEDSLNAGIPTDRLVAEWWIKVNDRTGHSPKPTPTHEILDDGSFEYLIDLESTEEDYLLIPVIYDISPLMASNRGKVTRFKNALTYSLFTLFKRDYVVSDFFKSDEATGYVLSKKRLLAWEISENPFS